MKYVVHKYVELRIPFEIEADSVKEAVEIADTFPLPENCQSTGEYTVDPLLPDGTVDYYNVEYVCNNDSCGCREYGNG